MAEDLSIKVKVEPDGGSVQGKLDEIAKKKKFNAGQLEGRTECRQDCR